MPTIQEMDNGSFLTAASGDNSMDMRHRKPQVITSTKGQPSSMLYQLDDDDKYRRKQSGMMTMHFIDWFDDVVDGVFRYDVQTMVIALSLTIASLALRTWHIQDGNFVIWDEAHFGKFASYYLKRTFYFDVHPPLGKMLVGLAGLFANYHGDFEFESGVKYPETLNYTVMRVFLSIFGALMVPFAYLTALELRLSNKAALFAASLVLFDNALLCISRYILLDSMLLFYTALTFYCMAVFHNCRSRPFSPTWWFWLCATGVSIGLVSSVKWVGFFVTALVGVYTIEDLWVKLGDLSMSLPRFVQHFLARAFALIAVPIGIYILCFWVHFSILSHSGPGDAQMSSLFQAGLEGNKFHENPLYVAYGSKLSLKNNGYGGGLLHSHVQTFPEGSKQQQVTTYHHKDSNNDWIVTRKREDRVPADHPIQLLQHGDIIRLVHASTGANLHSHPIPAPISKLHHEVSCYGNDTLGDSNDYWQVEVVSDMNSSNLTHVRSLTTDFRLKHVNLKCYLRAHNVHLPEWGFKQGEVICDKYATKDSNNLWNVEQHWNDKLPPGKADSYKSSFITDFIHLNVAMWSSNNALTPDPNKEDKLISSPRQWPFLSVGLRMCGWGDHEFKVYLLGNVFVWWFSTLSLIGFVVAAGIYTLRFRRGFNNWAAGEWDQFMYQGKTILMGWILHFGPFLLMGRVTYLHHYFPALYFAIFMAAFMTEHVAKYLPHPMQPIPFIVLGVVTVYVFWQFSPLTYGYDKPAKELAHLDWLSTWTVHD
eukprot:Partr_v1_DN27509_c0_g1_i1_m30853 putative Dolichyl-phosphate-mannose--protein mannosyltransferase